MADRFSRVDWPDAHLARRRAILKHYPTVKALMGNNPATAGFVFLLVGLQLSVAAGLAAFDAHWLLVVVFAYVLGAFPNHALYVLIHECTHNLVFKRHWPNQVLGIVCDFALVVPGAMAFRKYHLLHHKHMGVEALDADMPTQGEARLIGNRPARKALWMLFFSLSQALRPKKILGIGLWDRWVLANVVAVVAVDLLVLAVLGPKALVYLLLSTFFGLGLHPLGGRWIQEHFVTRDGQETYSYYGPLNRVCFNVGYHNEHHDFANVPWNNLPKLKAAAPEYYDSLASYDSWTGVLVRFILDPAMSTYSRITRAR
ncbi:MAG: fatty acid desaturase [Kiloniellales bacterium]|nr:fatty acid desaturase [Kiloniellales bacterium]